MPPISPIVFNCAPSRNPAVRSAAPGRKHTRRCAFALRPRALQALDFRTGVADGQDFPLVAAGLAPVDDATAVVTANLVVHIGMHRAAVWNAGGLDATEEGVELGLRDAETIVLQRDGFRPLVEVDGQA